MLWISGFTGGYAGYGVFFFWEKQLASLRHLFPCQKNTPHPPTDGQHRKTRLKDKSETKGKERKGKTIAEPDRLTAQRCSKTTMVLTREIPPMPVGAGWLVDFLPEKDV